MTLHVGCKSPFRTNPFPTNLSGNGLFLFLYGIQKAIRIKNSIPLTESGKSSAAIAKSKKQEAVGGLTAYEKPFSNILCFTKKKIKKFWEELAMLNTIFNSIFTETTAAFTFGQFLACTAGVP